MREKLAGALSVALAACATAVALATVNVPSASAAPSVPYSWRNVRIDAGGFVSGIVFNPTERNLIYARTDVGGAYRWNQNTSTWTPMLDWVGWDRWGWNGVLSLASDPVNPARVYAAVGMYLNSWDPNNGAILRSADRGKTWQVTELPFKVGGNMPGRGMGERLAVDPNNNNVLYFGAEAGQGLWRSTNAGVTWSQVTNFPNAGNYMQDPADPNEYLTFNQGVVWVAFDKASGTSGSTTPGIYVGVADLQNTVYRSTNGGSTWERVAGQPTGAFAHQGEVAGGALYIATSDKGGPYDGGTGAVSKYQISTGTWTDITPPTPGGGDNWYGFSGLSIDKQAPNTVMVTGYSSWWPDTFIFRSTDAGATWRSFWDYTNGNRTNHYKLDISSVPWLTYADQKSLPEQVPKLGWMTEALEIDPFNSNRMMYGGASVYGTTNLTALDTGGTVNLAPMVRAMESSVVTDLVSHPSGPLFSGMLDIGGFRHTNIDAVPALMYTPFMAAVTSLDYAEGNPMWMVRVGQTDRTNSANIAYSTDAGANWFSGSVPNGAQRGHVAMNANASRVVWSSENAGVFFSTSVGGSFSQSSGLPNQARVEADRVNANKFYGFSGGTFYVSTNGGQSFTAAATGLGSTGQFKTMPGVEGDIWLASDTGLYHSTNSGSTFSKIAASSSAVSIGFGAPAPGRTNRALYTMATIDGVRGVHRSDDAGASWVRINDDQHQYGNAGQAITGDPNVYGRVYLGTDGRGILTADPTGPPTSTTPSHPPTTATSQPPTPTSQPPTTTSPPPTGADGCSTTYVRIGQWGTGSGGFQGEVRVANTATTGTTSWTVTMTFANGQTLSQIWGGRTTIPGSSPYTVLNEGWNGALSPGQTATFGFIGNWNGANNPPTVSCARTL
jgi:xyloglucan-specific exo-beta-1,4-glucanase